MPDGRRRFLKLTLGGGVGAVLAGSAGTLAAAPAEDWLGAITSRKHRVFLDVGYFAPDGSPFRRTRALLTTLGESYGAKDGEVGIAFGAHSSGIAYMLTASAWAEFGVLDLVTGANLRAADVQTLRAASRDWAAVGAEQVAALQARGVTFLVCRQTIGRWAERIATARGVAPATVVASIVAALHPGVTPVPAMITAAVLSQEKGLGYVSIA